MSAEERRRRGGVWWPEALSVDGPRPVIDVVIPALNEEESLPKVLKALPDDWVRQVVVADNGSTDETADRARALGAQVVAEPERGYGAACLRALEYLAQDPPDVVVFLDGDFSDRPEELPRVVAPIVSGEADMVIGSRSIGHREAGALLPQARFGNALACALMEWMYGYQFTDLGPFRAIRWDALEELGMQDRNYGWTVEMQIKAARRRLSCVEVPVSYRQRIGKSKVTGTVKGSVLAGVKILYTLGKEYADAFRERAGGHGEESR